MRIEQLTFTRFIAAIAIFIFHYGKDVALFNNTAVSFIFKQANYGVSYFFVLSGFVMIIAYQKKGKINFDEFLKNRLARIYPLYVLAIFLVLLINHFHVKSYLDLLLNMFMIQTWVPLKALTINPPGWSLSVELFFYVIFPIVFNKFYVFKNLKLLTVGIILFWVLSQILFYLLVNDFITFSIFEQKTIFYSPILHLNQFLVGNLCGLWFVRNYEKYKKNYALLILVLFVLFLILLTNNNIPNYHNGLLVIVFAPIIVLLSLSNDRIVSFFCKKPLVFLGEISFGIYILQFPICLFLSHYRLEKFLGIVKGEDDLLIFIIRLLILIFSSAIIYKVFEIPVRNYIKNLRF